MSDPIAAALRFLVALLPVLCFLGALVSLDSFKLVRVRTVLLLIGAGALAALVALVLERAARHALGLDARALARYVAPWIEELLKGAVVVWLVARRRVGFLVDAAIAGFAVGAGFATAENLTFLALLDEPRPAVWLVRGFGTALMHGGVTASMAILAKSFADRHGSVAAWVYAPGFLLAVLVHAAFNHFLLGPDLTTLAVLVVLPLGFAAVFRISQAQTRRWLGTGFDTDSELLELINGGRVSTTPVGRYLQSLQTSFPPSTVVDMLCLLRLRLELSIRAKGILLLKQAGIEPRPHPEVREKLAELAFLERSIGTSGLAALRPMLSFSDQDLWQYHMLGEHEPRAAAARP